MITTATTRIKKLLITDRKDVVRHLTDEELDRLLSEADDLRIVRPLVFIKNLYKGDTLKEATSRVGVYPFETDLLLADCGFYNERVIRFSLIVYRFDRAQSCGRYRNVSY
jgi:hypothetical protein